MKVIGLTGGIGSGKSLVANLLKREYGAFILDTDSIAKAQMEPGGASYQEVIDYIGREIVLSDGTIDRAGLAAIIFNNSQKRLQINQITHPKVLTEVKRVIRTLNEQGDVPYLVVETALMLEAGYDNICDEVWYVYAPEEERRIRLKKERGYSEEKINSIFKNQKKDSEYRRKYSRVLENIGNITMLEKQVEQLLKSQ